MARTKEARSGERPLDVVVVEREHRSRRQTCARCPLRELLAGQEREWSTRAGPAGARASSGGPRAGRRRGHATGWTRQAAVLQGGEQRERRLGALVLRCGPARAGRRSRRRCRVVERHPGVVVAQEPAAQRSDRSQRVAGDRRTRAQQASARAATSIGCWSKPGRVPDRPAADGRHRQVVPVGLLATSQSSRSSPACRSRRRRSPRRGEQHLGQDGVGVASAGPRATARRGRLGRPRRPRVGQQPSGGTVAGLDARISAAPSAAKAMRRPGERRWRLRWPRRSAAWRATGVAGSRAAAVPSPHSARPHQSSTPAASVHRPADGPPVVETARRRLGAATNEVGAARRASTAWRRARWRRTTSTAGDVVDAVAVLAAAASRAGRARTARRRRSGGAGGRTTGTGAHHAAASAAARSRLVGEAAVALGHRGPGQSGRQRARPRRPSPGAEPRLGRAPGAAPRRSPAGPSWARAARRRRRAARRRAGSRSTTTGLPAATASISTPEVTCSRRVVGQQHDVGRPDERGAGRRRRGSGRRSCTVRPRPSARPRPRAGRGTPRRRWARTFGWVWPTTR